MITYKDILYSTTKILSDNFNCDVIVENQEGTFENECFYKEIKNDKVSYAIDIYCDKIDSSSLIIHSSRGYDDLERILKKEECIYGFKKSEDEDTIYRKFAFPKDEKKLLYITEKIINILQKEVS